MADGPNLGTMSRTFIARWSSKCSACEGWILKGQEATFTTAGDKVHVDCSAGAGGVFDLQPGEKVCQRCFLTTCDCEA